MRLGRNGRRQAGITLVELMVGILISLILLAGALALIVQFSVSGGESVQSTRLNQQMRGTLDQITKELQRAAYVNWFAAWDQNDDGQLTVAGDDVNGDGNLDALDFYEAAVPAIDTFGTVRTADLDNADCETDCPCVLYAYDQNDDGEFNPASEGFGFRFQDGAVEMRTGGAPHACNTGEWESITNENVVSVDDLSFELVYVNDETTGDSSSYRLEGTEWDDDLRTTCTPGAGGIEDDRCLWRRSLDINFEGSLVEDPEVEVDLGTSVKVRNDHFDNES